MTLRRRDFITLLSGAAAWPLAARGQQAVMPVIGCLYPGLPDANPNFLLAFRKGLSEAGYVEGQNLTIEYRWGQNDRARLPELAADLVRHRAAVIAVLDSVAAAVAAKAATTTIPIVFGVGGDPVESGLVASLNRPGGNVTGISYMNNELGGKRLGLLHELLPHAVRFAVLVNPNNPTTASISADIEAAASVIGQQLDILTATTNREIDTAFASLVQKRAAAVIVSPDPFFNNRRIQLISLALRHGLPAIYPRREYADAGGLMSYGSRGTEQYRLVGIYTGRILKGEKPADLPVMQPTKFEFVINRQTARIIGIEVPPTLIALADEIIE